MIGKEARGEVNKIFCLRAFKGRIIRKVMGGGGAGDFRAASVFFSLMFPLNEYFFCQDVVHEYFFSLK